jgi:hypothetical protein
MAPGCHELAVIDVTLTSRFMTRKTVIMYNLASFEEARGPAGVALWFFCLNVRHVSAYASLLLASSRPDAFLQVTRVRGAAAADALLCQKTTMLARMFEHFGGHVVEPALIMFDSTGA